MLAMTPSGDAMRRRFGWTIIATLACWLAMPAHAEVFSVEVGKSKLVRLQENHKPAVVFVGNPSIADVVIERSGVVFVLGREPGETDVWILDDYGNALLHRPVVVTALASRQVSVFRGPEEQTLACNPRCSTVVTPVGDERGGGGASASALLANPPTPAKSPSTEELIESLRELIPGIGQTTGGAKAGAGSKQGE